MNLKKISHKFIQHIFLNVYFVYKNIGVITSPRLLSQLQNVFKHKKVIYHSKDREIYRSFTFQDVILRQRNSLLIKRRIRQVCYLFNIYQQHGVSRTQQREPSVKTLHSPL